MIVNLFIYVLQGIVNVLLAPLSVLNFVVDVTSHIAIVQGFVKVVAYLFPWGQLTPLVTFIVAMFIFRSVVSLIKTIWELLPIL